MPECCDHATHCMTTDDRSDEEFNGEDVDFPEWTQKTASTMSVNLVTYVESTETRLTVMHIDRHFILNQHVAVPMNQLDLVLCDRPVLSIIIIIIFISDSNDVDHKK